MLPLRPNSPDLTGLEAFAANALEPGTKVRGLIESFPQKVGAVLVGHGGPTAYYALGHI